MPGDVCRAWLHGLRQRSQRSCMTLRRFGHSAGRYIPNVRTLHPSPNERLHHYLGQERHGPVPQVRTGPHWTLRACPARRPPV